MNKLTLLSVLLSCGLSFSQPANPANGGNMQRITNYGQQAFIDFGNNIIKIIKTYREKQCFRKKSLTALYFFKHPLLGTDNATFLNSRNIR